MEKTNQYNELLKKYDLNISVENLSNGQTRCRLQSVPNTPGTWISERKADNFEKNLGIYDLRMQSDDPFDLHLAGRWAGTHLCERLEKEAYQKEYDLRIQSDDPYDLFIAAIRAGSHLDKRQERKAYKREYDLRMQSDDSFDSFIAAMRARENLGNEKLEQKALQRHIELSR